MRSELIINTRSLSGSSDLTLLAPIKAGLVPSLESITYKSRLKRLLKTLNMGRSSTHEFALLRPFSDAVERVGKIHSVRVAVLEPEDKVLLAATFDGAWETYIRVLWQKVGALLDVIFCNTEDYVSAYDHSFEEWVGWANRVQIETAFFYGMPVTVDDVRYLKNQESLQRQIPAEPAMDLESTQRSVQRVESVAWNVTTGDGAHFKVFPETAKLGLQGLAALYRLTDVYLPASEDGKYLHRAARELLLEFVQLKEHTDLLEVSLDQVKVRFEKQLAWLQPAASDSVPHRQEPPELPTDGPPKYDAGDVQGGILGAYDGITHGCLLLIAFDNPAAAAEFLERLNPEITRGDAKLQAGALVRNVAFTYEGLRAIGLSEAQLAYFPEEFREGMEARASVLGDLRINHPRRWRLPVRNWPDAAGVEPERIELTAVHAVVQLRVGTKDVGQLEIEELNDPNHPLHNEVKRLVPTGKGARVLAVQPMRRYANPTGDSTEHFGFVDGIGQPVIDPKDAGKVYPNQVHLGELLLGYDNEADPAPDADSASCPVAKLERMAWLRNGSFLVVRKLKQDVEALEEAVRPAAARAGMRREDVLAKMMGRTLAGAPLVPNNGRNDFNYKFDAKGSACPFQAHVRRANPRSVDPQDVPEPPGRRAPRMMRRGMSYGPPYSRSPNSDARACEINAKERGIVFMAYNASIGEQFEVVQRWLSGGNSTGVYSGQSDPFLGVAENGQTRYFRFEHNNEVVRMAMDGWDALLQEPRPIVRLEWGAYLFTPSIKALVKLKEVAAKCACTLRPVWSAADGLRRIIALEALERERGPNEAAIAWKSVLEDPEAQEKFVSASVWAAIREHRGGVLHTPYGVLVADRDLVMKVLQDEDGHYTVRGYGERMVASIGLIYLGLDASGTGGPYTVQSAATNAAIQKIPADKAFELAREQTELELGRFIEEAKEQAKIREDYRWELTLDVREVLDKVLATICEYWFGLSEKSNRLKRGGSRWDWTPNLPPLYPGNFTAPSRYIFQPQPGSSVEDFGRNYGSNLRRALNDWISDHLAANTRPTDPKGNQAPIGEVIFGLANDPSSVDLAARTFVGALMGFLPTVDGNLRLTLNEWLRDGTFWSLRAALAGRRFADINDAKSLLLLPLTQAMQLRPSPELVWRTATRRHALGASSTGKVGVEPGDTVVVSIVSATQQCLADGKVDVFPIFGGDRSKTHHPTHACPGYGAGMSVILGILSALLEAKESMRPSVAPLAFVFEGPSGGSFALELDRTRRIALLREREAEALHGLESRRRASSDEFSGAPARLLRASAGQLLAYGDSWFHYVSLAPPDPNIPSRATNIAAVLKTQGYSFPVAPLGNSGISLEQMAAPRNRKLLRDALEELFQIKQPPMAILLSGGGNDVVRDRLMRLLKSAPQKTPLDADEVQAFIDGKLHGHYFDILKDIKTVCDAYKQKVRVLLHAYDHPIPDGRFLFGSEKNPRSWLYPSITQRGYNVTEGTKIMRCLIDHLHAMQNVLAGEFLNVRHVPVAGTSDPFASNYKEFWENELHPTPMGFGLVAKKFVDVLNGP